MYDDATGERVFPGYAIRRFGHAGVAIIGVTLRGAPLVTTPAGVKGLVFLDEADAVNALVPKLKARGVNAIVVLFHEGGVVKGLYGECVQPSGPLFDVIQRFDPAVDVVIAAHTNAAHVCDVSGRLVTSAASNGRLVSAIEMHVDELTGEVTAKSASNVIVTRDVPADEDQTKLIARYETLSAPFANRVVATIAADLPRAANPAGESPLGDVIADSQLEATQAAGAVAAFMNPGGIRTDLLHAQVSGGEAPGEVTYGELFAVQPFGNTLVTMSVTGEMLHTLLEQQWSVAGGAEKANVLAVSHGFTYTWDSTKPVGDRVAPTDILLDGQVVDPAATYRVTVNNFLGDGGDGFAVLRNGTDRAGGGLDLAALEAWLPPRSPVVPPAADRIARVPAP